MTHKIKNEHELEDVVIVLSDESFILSQSKSSHDDEESPNSLKYLKKGLLTLHESSLKEPNHRLIYITNIRMMLGRRTVYDDFISGKTVWFEQMSEHNKKLIRQYAPENFDYGNFGIQFLKYIGDDEKEKWILDKMKQIFLNKFHHVSL